MPQIIAITALTLSAIFSGWLYWGSDIKVERELTSREWQSTMVTYIDDSVHIDSLVHMANLAKVVLTSNVKYLPNKTYLRVSYVEMISDDPEKTATLNISESGSWELSDNYLLINPAEFKDMSDMQGKAFTQKQIDTIKQIFIMDAEQSRRVDVINKRAVLLTSLDHGSRILTSN